MIAAQQDRNRDVPQCMWCRRSSTMTSRNDRALRAALDKTVREHWEKARKVSATGQPCVSPDAAQRRRLGQAPAVTDDPGAAQRVLPAPAGPDLPARQLAPDLPDVRHHSRVPAPAPRPSAGRLTAPHSRPPSRRAHLRRPEMNKQVAGNLDKIITVLEAGEDGHQEAAADAS